MLENKKKAMSGISAHQSLREKDTKALRFCNGK
jgi:hypothetical protein